jgi:hypothetical protein
VSSSADLLAANISGAERREYVPCVDEAEDYDFHPHEDDCRRFVTTSNGVLRFDDEAFVTEVRWSAHRILRHYAFADRWVKVNLSRANDGEVLDFNCDIATPFVRSSRAVYAVDLFIDVLVASDATTFRVKDEDDFERALASRLVSTAEAKAAKAELARFTEEVSSGRLLSWLEDAYPLSPPASPPPSVMSRVPVPEFLRSPRRWPPDSG